MTQTAPHPIENPSILWQQTARIAAIDRVLTRLAEQGLLPPHQSCVGEEAVLVGAAAAMESDDWIFWGRQVNAAALARGLSTSALLAYQLFDQDPAGIAALKVVVSTAGPATRIPHAVGVAHAARNDQRVVLCELGDGVVTDGDFHVGLTFAGVLSAPVVFVIRSDGQRDFAPRGAGYGIHTNRVSGDDPQAVHDAVANAVQRARAGDGPTLLEAIVQRDRSVVQKAQWSAFEEETARALAAAEAKGNAS